MRGCDTVVANGGGSGPGVGVGDPEGGIAIDATAIKLASANASGRVADPAAIVVESGNVKSDTVPRRMKMMTMVVVGVVENLLNS